MSSQVFYIKYNAYPTVSPSQPVSGSIWIKFNKIAVPNVINTGHDIWVLFTNDQAPIQGTVQKIDRKFWPYKFHHSNKFS